MPSLERQKNGAVCVRPYSVQFSMCIAGSTRDVVCVQTAAGFEKVLGRKNFTSEEMLAVFGDHRVDFEALASMLYEAQAGDALTITITTAYETPHAETGADNSGT
jgi:hypothetical protein